LTRRTSHVVDELGARESRESLVGGEVRVEELHRGLVPVAMCREVYGRRAAHAEHALEGVFPTKDLA
jgi:hypothetical protein